MPEAKRSSLVVIFVTVFIDLLGFGIVVPLLQRYAAVLQAARVPAPGVARQLQSDSADAGDSANTAKDDAAMKAGTARELTPAENAIIGLLMASFSAMQFLFSPIWGRLSDRVGRRPVLMMGLLSSAVFYALFGYATLVGSLLLVFVSRIGAGIAGATISTAQAYIADVTSETERGKGMALIGAAFGIGFTFGPLLGSLWVSDRPDAPPSPAPGFVAAGLSFIAFCCAVFVLHESLRRDVAQPARQWIHFRSLKTALSVPTIGMLLLTFFVATFAFANFEPTLARLTKEPGFGFSDRGNFYLFAYVGFSLSLAQGLFVRRLIPVIGEVAMTVAGTVLMGAGLLGVAFSALQASTVLLLVVLPVSVSGFACLTPSLQSLISRRTAANIQGEVLGVVQSASSMARILGPLSGNILYGVGPGHASPYFFGAGVMGLALVLALAVARGE